MLSPAHSTATTAVAIGLGTNVGDRRAALAGALDQMRRRGLLLDPVASRLYASDAMLPPGAPPAWAMPFLNQVVVGRTALAPLGLLDGLQQIERALGRQPHEHWAPRTIDLDLLLYGGRAIDHPRLCVPHRGLLERPFVILPLAEVAPGWLFPGEGPAANQPCGALARAFLAHHGERLPFATRLAEDEGYPARRVGFSIARTG